MKKLCCFPCAETPNIHISLQCLSACCQSKSEKRHRVIKEKSEKREDEKVKESPKDE